MTNYIYAPFTIGTGQIVNLPNTSVGYWLLDDPAHLTIPSLTNAGTINVSSSAPGGVGGISFNISQYNDAAYVWNQATGSIYVSGGSSVTPAIGIYVNTWGGDVVNDGLIDVTSSDPILAATGIEDDDPQSAVSNNGTLHVSSSIGQATGFYGYSGVQFVNNGTIQVSGGTGYGHPSIGIQSNAATNNGTVSVTDATGQSIGVALGGTFVNTGTIEAVYAINGGGTLINSGTLQGIVRLSDYGPDTVNNTGQIIGEVHLGKGNDTFNGASGQDTGGIFGEDGDDVVHAGVSDDFINGGNGNDLLDGGLGNDTILGGTGNDTLIGGPGADVLTGGTGRDLFKYASVSDLAGDTITDFDPSADRIDLSAIAGLSFIGNASFSGVAGQVRYEWSGGNTLLEVDSDGNGKADATLTLQGQVSLSETSGGSEIFGQASTDFTPPYLIFSSPADTNWSFPVDGNFVFTFLEPVKAGAGNINIYADNLNNLAMSIPITDASQVTISGNTVTVNPTANLWYSQNYYVEIDPDVIVDLVGNGYAGISGDPNNSQSRIAFRTVPPPDTTPPTFIAGYPAWYGPPALVNTNLQLDFSEAVKAGSGTIDLYKKDPFYATGTLIASFLITDTSQVSISGSTITINPSFNLDANTTYYVLMNSGVVQDLAGNKFPGLSHTTDFFFTTTPTADITPPSLLSTSPTTGAFNVPVASNIILTFDESVAAGSGEFKMSALDTPNITGASFNILPFGTGEVTIAGSTVTINPNSNMLPGKRYYVTIESTFLRDTSGNYFPGISSTTAFTFTTQQDALHVGSDFDGNLNGDILWQDANGQAMVWLMNGLAAASGGYAGPNPGTTWHIKGLGDFNGDGRGDILWQNDDGTPAIWFMNASTVAGSGVASLNPGPSWHVIASGDFNGDGKSDILWQNDDGTPAIWLMNGTNLVAAAALTNPGSSWHVIASADFNGDGKSDILWQNDNGQAAIWFLYQNPTPALGYGTLVGPNPGSAWKIQGAADFNGDGMADILWQNSDGTPAVWLMNGASILSGGSLANPGSSWHALALGG